MTVQGTQCGNGAIDVHAKSDVALPRVTEDEFRRNAKDLIEKTRQGEQFAVVDAQGKILQIVGMNGKRMLPRRDIDALINEDGRRQPLSQGNQWVE